jgi:hypothetical protein
MEAPRTEALRIPAMKIRACVPGVPMRMVFRSAASPFEAMAMLLLPVVQSEPALVPMAMLLLPMPAMWPSSAMVLTAPMVWAVLCCDR